MSKEKEAIVIASEKGYYISKEGKVFSKNQALRCRPDTNGYLMFSIRGQNRKKLYIRVHRLQAFQKFSLKVFEKGMQVRHLNGNKIDNSWNNIDIGTMSQNCMDKTPISRKIHAAKCRLKMTQTKVDELRHDYNNGLTYNQLIEKYRYSKSKLSYYLSKTAKKTTFTFKNGLQ